MDYLRKSPNGFYSYRRRVPDDLRKQVGRREWKRSLKTKSKAEALLRGAQTNRDVERTIAALRQTLPENKSLILRQAADMLRAWDIHPDQAPILKPGYTLEEFQAFKAQEYE
jgi:hypothetical protein